jgi:uncharacterized RDD family membrane protein YckC
MSEEFVTLNTPDHGTLQFELAGPGSRFCAHVVDGLLIVFCIALLVLLLLAVGSIRGSDFRGFFEGGGDWSGSWGVAFLILCGFLVYWGYYVLFECLMQGRTPGKREFGIRVIRADGLPIGFRESALRNLLRAADALPPPCYALGGVVMFLDRYGRRLGDLVAGTLVIRENFEVAPDTEAGAAWAARVEQGQSRHAVTLPGGQLTVSQADLLERFLARREALDRTRRDALAWQIAAPLLPLIGEDPAAWKDRPDRLEQCERALMDLAELAKSHRPALSATVDQPPETLF